MPTSAQRRIENIMQRRLTKEFISGAEFEAIFHRTAVVRDTEDRGGLVETHSYDLPPQTVRIAHGPPRRRRLENSPPNETWSELSYAKDNLVGPADLDIEIGDTFEAPDGVGYVVLYVFQDRDYETIANVGSGTQ
jgi:hypothetical protein